MKIEDVNIRMSGYEFNRHNLSFYANNDSNFPDEIDITVVHTDFNSENAQIITNGIYVFLENYLGELKFATTIDSITVHDKSTSEDEPIPIEKLIDYLNWRQKELVEKYHQLRYSTENDTYSGFEATSANNNPLIAIINTDVLKWEGKHAYPWLLLIEISYEGVQNGMPDKETYTILSHIEEELLMTQLTESEGYLNIGRQTSENVRLIYFACVEFRKPSLVLREIVKKYAGLLEIEYDIYKDKYWRTFDKFVIK